MEEFDEETRLKFRDSSVMDREEIPIEDTFGHRVCDRAIDFLEKHGNEDFFLAVSLDEPHGPFLCPEPFASMYKDYAFPKTKAMWDRLEGKPDSHHVWAGGSVNQDKDSIVIKNPYYFGCNSFADYELGRVLDSIEKYAEDALIIYTSDHGHFMGFHSLSTKGPAFYDDIARIPFIVKWPGVTPEGSVYRHPASHIDVFPTILDAAGIKIPHRCHGKSMFPALKDPQTRLNDYIFTEFNAFEVWNDGCGSFQPMRSVFDGKYKFSVNLMSTDELYDIENDPEEMVNLINDPAHNRERDRLHDALLAWQNDSIDPFRGYYWERRPWRTDAKPANWTHDGHYRYYENEPGQPRMMNYMTGLPFKDPVWPQSAPNIPDEIMEKLAVKPTVVY
jgi:uncharacterized sulfatase